MARGVQLVYHSRIRWTAVASRAIEIPGRVEDYARIGARSVTPAGEAVQYRLDPLGVQLEHYAIVSRSASGGPVQIAGRVGDQACHRTAAVRSAREVVQDCLLARWVNHI